MKPLHIAASLRIVAKHKHIPGVTIDQARDVIRELAKAKTLTQDDRRLIEDLQRVTEMSIADLAERTREWVPGDDPSTKPPQPRRPGSKPAS